MLRSRCRMTTAVNDMHCEQQEPSLQSRAYHVLRRLALLIELINEVDGIVQDLRNEWVTTAPPTSDRPHEDLDENEILEQLNIAGYRHERKSAFEEYQAMLRFSFMLMAFTHLESGMLLAATALARDERLRCIWESTSGSSTIGRFKTFWNYTRCLRPELPALEQELKLADEIRAVRNVIAHRYGRFASAAAEDRAKRDDKRVDALIAREIGVHRVSASPVRGAHGQSEPSDFASIRLDVRFCVQVVRDSKKLCGAIFESAGIWEP